MTETPKTPPPDQERCAFTTQRATPPASNGLMAAREVDQSAKPTIRCVLGRYHDGAHRFVEEQG